ncbi:type II and III secretion system protein family protein [bacterium]|nr:type II and III secretion system protein family protein [bacterium]
MSRQIKIRPYSKVYLSLIIMVAFCLVYFVVCLADAAGGGIDVMDIDASTTPQVLNLTTGKSFILRSKEVIYRVSLAAPSIADAMILTPQEIYLTGKSPGITNITIWKGKEKILAIYDVQVMPDVSRLKEKIHELFPQEEGVLVTAAHDSINLAGSVTSAASLSKIITLAQSFSPKINNLLEVIGVQQVMLEVQVSEISRTLLKELGVEFGILNDTGQIALNTLKSVSVESVAGFLSAEVFRYPLGTSWGTLIRALKDQGMLKILAEPTLITQSGKTAEFLAGGEFPYLIPEEENKVAIEWKQFGVGLKFTPTILGNDKINMDVAPEVSELNYSNSIMIGGFVIPPLDVRRVSTSVELGDGQSFAIAGLLKDDVREKVRKYPVLGDIPVLGALFRSSSFQKNQTELVIFVTPHLVKPVDRSKQTLPTDAYIEPDDFEFYLLGSMEGRDKKTTSSPQPEFHGINKKGGLEGDFGHIQTGL